MKSLNQTVISSNIRNTYNQNLDHKNYNLKKCYVCNLEQISCSELR